MTAEVPRVFLLDPRPLRAAKRRLDAGDPELAPALAALRAEADAALAVGPFSVIDKEATPPSGDKHDYLSLGTYWWPDPAQPDGRPYIRRDGEVNPEGHTLDNAALRELCAAIETLALAYHFSGHEPYAAHAARLLRAWFLDEATRMNPHLEYAQAIPGVCAGRGIGIIDTAKLVPLIDAVGLLGGAAAWTAADHAGLTAWFRRYLRWLIESAHGRAEAAEHNNHGTWFDVQTALFALFVGEEATARAILRDNAPSRIASQIEPDGRQPHELVRTRSLSYSTMNLRGFCDLATLGERVGVDLWAFLTADGRGLRQALAWLHKAAVPPATWDYPQITPPDWAALALLLRRAALRYDDPTLSTGAERLPGVEATTERSALLYATHGGN